MRLQPVGLPVPHHSAGADAQHRPHLACAPVRGRLGLALRGQLHQPLYVHLHRRRSAGQVPLYPFKTELHVALAPARNLHAAHAQLVGQLGNALVLQTLRGQQHDPRALRQAHTRALGACERAQLGFLLFAQLNHRGNSQSLSPMQTEVGH